MESPNYYAVIPATVRYDKKLSDKAKILYGEISALAQKDGKCWATNRYFAELYSVSTVTISNLIKQLVDNGYITSEIIYKEGTKEIDKRYLRIVCDPIKENFNTPIKESFNTPIKENFKENNTSNNNTSINNTSIIKEKVSKDTQKKEEKIHYGEFVTMTNAEYDKLVSTHGKKFTDQCIEMLDNYKGSKGATYKSDYRAILSWVVKQVKKDNSEAIKESRKPVSFAELMREEYGDNDEEGSGQYVSDNTSSISSILSSYSIE